MKGLIYKNIRNIKIISIFLVSISVNVISNWLYSMLTEQDILSLNIIGRALLTILILCIAIFIFNKLSGYIISSMFPEIFEKENIAYAHQQIEGFASREQGRLIEKNSLDDESIASLSYDSIKDLISTCYNLFEAKYANIDPLLPILFEVTFMTKSYIDNEITIPACCNKGRRSPTSMRHRELNKKIYDNTVTAAVYRDAERKEPHTYIIEDTGREPYDELYVEQKERIKSSIIFPVLSSQKALLGTIVVHCDKPRFFLKRKQKYWKNILEIFSVQVGKEKIKLDILNEGIKQKTF